MKDNYKWLIKNALAKIFLYSKIFSIYKRSLVSKRDIILLYHNVVDDDATHLDYSPDGMNINRDLFNYHLFLINKHFKAVSLNELVNSI